VNPSVVWRRVSIEGKARQLLLLSSSQKKEEEVTKAARLCYYYYYCCCCCYCYYYFYHYSLANPSVVWRWASVAEKRKRKGGRTKRCSQLIQIDDDVGH
jgi:hypothetical protein